MNKSTKFSPEVRERAVRMVQEHRGEYPSLWAAVESIAPKIGCVPQTLLSWAQQPKNVSGTILARRPPSRIVPAQRCPSNLGHLNLTPFFQQFFPTLPIGRSLAPVTLAAPTYLTYVSPSPRDTSKERLGLADHQ